MQSKTILHAFAPVFDGNSRVLILGTMPSPRSREEGFYYSHPQNRFWSVMSDIFGEVIPQQTGARVSFLLHHHIALWDVLASCDISGADDGSIKNPVANDLSIILLKADISAVFTTGKKAAQLYTKLCFPFTGIPAQCLPSTSPANAGMTYGEIRDSYKTVREILSADEQ